MKSEKFQELLCRIDNVKFDRKRYQQELQQENEILRELRNEQSNTLTEIEKRLKYIEQSLPTDPSKQFDMKIQQMRKMQSISLQKSINLKKQKANRAIETESQSLQKIKKKKKEFMEQIKYKQGETLEKLSNQLEYIKGLAMQIQSRKSHNEKERLKILARNNQELDVVLRNQEAELREIDDVEIEVLEQCKSIQDHMLAELEDKANKGDKKQMMLYRKISELITDFQTQE